LKTTAFYPQVRVSNSKYANKLGNVAQLHVCSYALCNALSAFVLPFKVCHPVVKTAPKDKCDKCEQVGKWRYKLTASCPMI